eukprot:RCo039417
MPVPSTSYWAFFRADVVSLGGLFLFAHSFWSWTMASAVLSSLHPRSSATSPQRSLAFRRPKAMRNLFEALGAADTMGADSTSFSSSGERTAEVSALSGAVGPRLDAAVRRAHARTPLPSTRQWRRRRSATMLTSLAVDLSTEETSPRACPHPLQLKPLQVSPSGCGADETEDEGQRVGLSSAVGSSEHTKGNTSAASAAPAPPRGNSLPPMGRLPTVPARMSPRLGELSRFCVGPI